MPNTCYSEQIAIIDGADTIYVRLPFTPEQAFFDIYNERIGNTYVDPSFTYSIEILPLIKNIDFLAQDDEQTRRFMKFAQWFSQYAGILSARFGNQDHSVYCSLDKKVEIYYTDEIIDDQEFYIWNGAKYRNPNYGMPSPTSMRVMQPGKDAPIIMELAQKFVLNYSYPQRMVLLAHEYSHLCKNKNPDDEKEADMNALLLCLSMGFGRQELGNAFLKVFARNQTDENDERILYILSLIKQFHEADQKYGESI